MKTRSGIAFALVTSMAALLTALSATAIAADTVLPVGATEWPPFEYASPEGKSIGSDTEVIEHVLRRMGYAPDMKLQPWKRVETSGERGELAAVYSIIKTPEREKFFYFSDPISTSRTVFFKKKSLSLHWKSFDDLKAMRVATGAGYAYPEPFMDAVKQKKFKSAEETFGATPELTNLRNLLLGRVDLAICEVSVCQYLIKTHAPEFDGIDYSPNVIGSVLTMHLGFSKKWLNAEGLTKEFNAELAKFSAAGLRKKIFDKYGVVSDLK